MMPQYVKEKETSRNTNPSRLSLNIQTKFTVPRYDNKIRVLSKSRFMLYSSGTTGSVQIIQRYLLVAASSSSFLPKIPLISP